MCGSSSLNPVQTSRLQSVPSMLVSYKLAANDESARFPLVSDSRGLLDQETRCTPWPTAAMDCKNVPICQSPTARPAWRQHSWMEQSAPKQRTGKLRLKTLQPNVHRLQEATRHQNVQHSCSAFATHYRIGCSTCHVQGMCETGLHRSMTKAPPSSAGLCDVPVHIS